MTRQLNFPIIYTFLHKIQSFLECIHVLKLYLDIFKATKWTDSFDQIRNKLLHVYVLLFSEKFANKAPAFGQFRSKLMHFNNLIIRYLI